MKKYIAIATLLIISLQAYKKHPIIIKTDEPIRPVITCQLHDAVKLIIKKMTRLDMIA